MMIFCRSDIFYPLALSFSIIVIIFAICYPDCNVPFQVCLIEIIVFFVKIPLKANLLYLYFLTKFYFF